MWLIKANEALCGHEKRYIAGLETVYTMCTNSDPYANFSCEIEKAEPAPLGSLLQ